MSTNIFLDNKAKELKIKNYVNCRCKDELIGIKCKEHECGIINTTNIDTNDIHPHWTSFYVNGKEKYYFCSYGSPILPEVKDYLGKHILTSNFMIQSFNSQICGELSLIVIYLLDNCCKFESIILELFKT